MIQKYILLFAVFFTLALSSKAQFRSVSVTGFNADIIANGVGDASASTNAGADAGPYAFVAEDFMAMAGGTSPTYYLPSSRVINSAATSGLSFTLADYSSNNALRLSSATSINETLVLDTPQDAAEVYLLAYSGSGSSTADITVNFSDGTTQMASFTIADWFNGTPFVIQGIGRVNTTDNSFSGTATNPRLYSLRMVLDYANFSKSITSINVSKTNTTTSVLGILAVSTLKINPQYSPAVLTGFNADVVADGIGDPMLSTTNDVDAATPPYVFVAADYQYDPGCAVPARKLPVNGFISSSAIPGMAYQLAPFSGSNDLRLTGSDAGTLTLGTPTASKMVYLLGVSGNGASKIAATVTFTDNTTQFFDSLTIADWYAGTTNIVTSGIGRVNRTTTGCGGLETSAASPKLYQIPLALDTANYMKSVSSITITRIDGITGFAGVSNIVAVTVENTNQLLPVTLSEFRGYKNEGGNQLLWSTKTESGNKGFEIQKSANGTLFSKIGFTETKATLGSSTRTISYSYSDAKANANADSYYRLKQINKDGRETYSNTILIKGVAATEVKLTALYPNPVNKNVTVSLTSPITETASLIITDVTGKVVLQKSINVAGGTNNYQINTDNLSKGSYILKVICNSGCALLNTKFIRL